MHGVKTPHLPTAISISFCLTAYFSRDYSRLGQVHKGLPENLQGLSVWDFYGIFLTNLFTSCHPTNSIKAASLLHWWLINTWQVSSKPLYRQACILVYWPNFPILLQAWCWKHGDHRKKQVC